MEGGSVLSSDPMPFGTKLFDLPERKGVPNSYLLDASDTRIALAHAADTAIFTGYTAALGARTPVKLGPLADPWIAVGGNVVASTGREAGQFTAVTRDFAAGGGPRTLGVGVDPQVAGGFVAYLQSANGGPGQIVVHDLTTGAVAYRIPSVGGRFALGEDGTVVTSASGGGTCGTTVAWASPADPAPHPVALGAVCGPVLYAGGRIAALRLRGTRFVEVVLADLAGTARVVGVQPRGRPSATSGLFLHDLSPARLLWGYATCSGPNLSLETDLDLPFSPDRPPAVACPMSIAGPARLKATAAGKVLVPVRCPRSCPPTVVEIRVGGARAGVGTTTLVLAPTQARPPGVVAVQLSRAARTRLTRRGSVTATITAKTADLDGSARTATKSVTIVR